MMDLWMKDLFGMWWQHPVTTCQLSVVMLRAGAICLQALIVINSLPHLAPCLCLVLHTYEQRLWCHTVIVAPTKEPGTETIAQTIVLEETGRHNREITELRHSEPNTKEVL